MIQFGKAEITLHGVVCGYDKKQKGEKTFFTVQVACGKKIFDVMCDDDDLYRAFSGPGAVVQVTGGAHCAVRLDEKTGKVREKGIGINNPSSVKLRGDGGSYVEQLTDEPSAAFAGSVPRNDALPPTPAKAGLADKLGFGRKAA